MLGPKYSITTSIKNNVATSITYIYVYDKPVIKNIHYTINVMITEAKLFAIRCGINQASSISDIAKIEIITDSLHATQRIFDSSSHTFQIYSASILNKLRRFFLQISNNSIEFWKYPSCCNWFLHKAVNRKFKQLYSILYYPCKLSWDFSKKSKCNNILLS